MNDKNEIIKKNWDYLNKHLDMESIPKEFRWGLANMVEILRADIATLSLVRTKEHAEYILNKSQLKKLCVELEEALDYWNKRIKPMQFAEINNKQE